MRLKYEKQMTSRVFTDPTKRINDYYINVDMKIKRMQNEIQKKLNQTQNEATNYIMKLDALSPLKTLSRGYSITEVNGNIVSKKEQVKISDEINVRLQDGKIIAIINNII